jgi:hypothetical protein
MTLCLKSLRLLSYLIENPSKLVVLRFIFCEGSCQIIKQHTQSDGIVLQLTVLAPRNAAINILYCFAQIPYYYCCSKDSVLI